MTRFELNPLVFIVWLACGLHAATALGGTETIFENGLPEGSFGAIADIDNELFIADDFMLATTQVASTIRWYGFYQGDEPATPERFIVRYHADAAGEPALDSFVLVDEFITRQSTALMTNSGRPVFTYEAEGPGLLQSGTRYWVAIQKQDTGDPDYLWLASDPFSGNALFQFDGGAWEALPVEQAFSLLPEPGGGISVVGVLLALAGLRRVNAKQRNATRHSAPRR